MTSGDALGSLPLPARTRTVIATLLVASFVVIPTSALQGLSTRTVFVLAMSLFCTGTLVAGVAPGILGVAGGPGGAGQRHRDHDPAADDHDLDSGAARAAGVVIANVSVVISVAPAIGPTLSGLILQFLPWRFLFLLVLPVGLIALAYGYLRLVNVGETGSRRFDVGSVLLSVPAFGDPDLAETPAQG